jgi:large subunit ribosomal protein L17
MRHGKKVSHLGRKTAHRKSMLANMASSLIEHKRIHTTVAKAKALKQFVEPLITKSKNDSTHNRRIVFSSLRDKYAVTELFREISQKVGDRPGGYTRIIKLGNRLGDNADMAMIELVDYNDVYNKEASKGRKRRRRSKKATDEAEVVENTEEVTEPVEAVVEETKAVEDAPLEEAASEEEVKKPDSDKSTES